MIYKQGFDTQISEPAFSNTSSTHILKLSFSENRQSFPTSSINIQRS